MLKFNGLFSGGRCEPDEGLNYAGIGEAFPKFSGGAPLWLTAVPKTGSTAGHGFLCSKQKGRVGAATHSLSDFPLVSGNRKAATAMIA
jgi:hypothetical protein